VIRYEVDAYTCMANSKKYFVTEHGTKGRRWFQNQWDFNYI